MPIILDTTTRAEYLALTTASSRASLVVSALPAPVVCEVYDGQDVLRASGTMQSPWATASGATVTVGEVTGQGIDVLSGGTPTADWYCQFRSGTRFVRGTFGVLGSGRDFVWSLASFTTGSRGTLGTVTLAAGGSLAPVLVSPPSVIGVTQVGQTLNATTGVWDNAPTSYSYEWARASTVAGPFNPISGATAFSYVLQSVDLNQYVVVLVTATNGAGSAPSTSGVSGPVTASVVGAPVNTAVPTIEAYNGQSATQVGSCLVARRGAWTMDVEDSNSWFPDPYPGTNRGDQHDGVMRFFLQRRYQWMRNGSPITDAVGMTYATGSADSGQQISVRETVNRVEQTPGQNNFREAATLYTATSAPIVPSTGSRAATRVYPEDLQYMGSYRLNDPYFVNGIAQEGFGGGGYGMCWDVNGNGGNGSFFLANSFYYNRTAEFARPATLSGPNAAILQMPRDAREGWADPIDETQGRPLWGQLIYNNMLIQSSAGFYTLQRPPVSHARRPKTLSVTGQVQSALFEASADLHGRFTAGQMCHVPAAWQSALGGPVLGGIANLSINSGVNVGPPAFSFNPDDIALGGTRFAQPLAAYKLPASISSEWKSDPNGNDTGDLVNGSQDPMWSSAALGYGNRAMVLPFGTKSLLHFGIAPSGRAGYGNQNQYETQRLPSWFGGGRMSTFDPHQPSRGPTGWPFDYACWAYDLDELARVRNGEIQPGQARPYAKWGFTLPTPWRQDREIMSGCYDPVRREIHIVQSSAFAFQECHIHVFRVNNAVAI
jgi:hypothetical protein